MRILEIDSQETVSPEEREINDLDEITLAYFLSLAFEIHQQRKAASKNIPYVMDEINEKTTVNYARNQLVATGIARKNEKGEYVIPESYLEAALRIRVSGQIDTEEIFRRDRQIRQELGKIL